MSIEIQRDLSSKMKHTVRVRQHGFTVDEPEANGGEDLGVTPHELYDSALGACKALTTLWYARRRQIPPRLRPTRRRRPVGRRRPAAVAS